MHCGDRGQSSDSSSSPSTCLVPAAPPPHTHPSGPAPRKSAAGGHSREAAARGGLRGPGTPGSETGWEQSHGDDQPVGEGQGSKVTASFRASHRAAWGPRLASPARLCHPWQSSVYTTCGWSASPSWVSRSSLRPGTWKTAGRLGGVCHSRWGEGQQPQKPRKEADGPGVGGQKHLTLQRKKKDSLAMHWYSRKGSAPRGRERPGDSLDMEGEPARHTHGSPGKCSV